MERAVWGDWEPQAGIRAGAAARPTGYTDSMRRTALLRLKAVLAAAVLGSAGGMPVVDLVMHDGRMEEARPHFEAANSPHSHGDVCTLGSVLPCAPQAVPLDVSLPIHLSYGHPGGVLTATAPRSSERNLLSLPRPPPGLPA